MHVLELADPTVETVLMIVVSTCRGLDHYIIKEIPSMTQVTSQVLDVLFGLGLFWQHD